MPLALRPSGMNPSAALPAPVQGALWMCAAATAFAVMINLVRYLTQILDPLQVVFFRNAFGLVAMLPWLMSHGLGVLRTQRIGLHLLRSPGARCSVSPGASGTFA